MSEKGEAGLLNDNHLKSTHSVQGKKEKLAYTPQEKMPCRVMAEEKMMGTELLEDIGPGPLQGKARHTHQPSFPLY